MGFMDKLINKAQEVAKAGEAKLNEVAANRAAAPAAAPGPRGPSAAGAAVDGAGGPGLGERQYVPGAPAPAGLYPPGVFALDELGYPKLDDIFGFPIKADGVAAEQAELEGMGISYPSPEDPRYWTGGMDKPW
jgi:hypothetical protein